MSRFLRPLLPWSAAIGLGCLSVAGGAQQERHGRGYKPPPPTAQITVTVEKGFNQKPLPNASVVFRAERDGKLTGNLETKTDPDGRASLDLMEVGSHITIQVIASGFATFATDFDLTGDGKELLVKLQRPRAQVSQYGESGDRPAQSQPGVQERAKPTTASPAPASPTAPLQTTPPADTPATQPSTDAPQKPGTPQ